MDKRILAIGLPVAAILWLLTGFVSIDAGKIGVVTQFGRVTGRELQPGLAIIFPKPFQSVVIFDTRIQKDQVVAGAASSDLQEVNATLAVNYRLERGRISEIYQTVGRDYKDRVIDQAIQESFKSTTAQFNAQDLITKRAEVKQLAQGRLQDRLKTFGIEVDDLSLVDFRFSAEFNKAIESKQVVQQEALRAEQELTKVKIESEQALTKARAEAEGLRIQRENVSPELIELRKVEAQLKAIEKWDGKLPQYMGAQTVFGIPTSN